MPNPQHPTIPMVVASAPPVGFCYASPVSPVIPVHRNHQRCALAPGATALPGCRKSARTEHWPGALGAVHCSSARSHYPAYTDKRGSGCRTPHYRADATALVSLPLRSASNGQSVMKRFGEASENDIYNYILLSITNNQ